MVLYDAQPGANHDDTFSFDKRVTAAACSIEQSG
jgi:hypothetical protein